MQHRAGLPPPRIDRHLPDILLNSMADARDYYEPCPVLASHGLYSTDPNPRVGCVLVKDDRIVGRGLYRAGEACEINALEMAGSQACGSTVYVTLEPCCHHGRTSCTDALLEIKGQTGRRRHGRPQSPRSGRGLAQLQAAGVIVDCGLLAAEAAR
ncbi:MAG: hypothetical protein R3F37_09445 [Candidatus Competibacteraceae bacterium]